MTFKQEFKTECFKAFQYSPFINKIMENLDNGNSANLRSYMDASIDDLQEEINQVIGDGEHAIHNARVTQLRAMYTCWYKLFNLLDAVDTQSVQDTNYELL